MPNIYEKLDVATAINAVGTKTRIGGTRIRPEAAEAMLSATNKFARISDLQARASEVIQTATGAEAGYVVTGAAAGLTLAASACIAKHDLAAMAQLPNTDSLDNEIIVPKAHRNSYDHALRASGATLVEVGNNDKTLGTVANDLEPWEIEAAVSEKTAAMGYVARGELPIEPIVDIAERHDLPVIVDAAGSLPPKHNLQKYVEAGADIVVFSGGKAIRGPQSTGIIAGKRELISSMALQHLDMDVVIDVWDPPAELINVDSLPGVPRHGIGRGFKVGKEELVGLIQALELYLQEDEGQLLSEWNKRSRYIGEQLETENGLDIEYINKEEDEYVTSIKVKLNKDAETTAIDLVKRLRKRKPRIFVGDRDVAQGIFTINPMSLTGEETEKLIQGIKQEL